MRLDFETVDDAAAPTATTSRGPGDRTSLGFARFPSAEAVVETEVRATPLSQRLDAAAYQRILGEAHQVLDRFAEPDGTLGVPIRATMIAAARPPLRRPEPDPAVTAS